MRSQSTARQKGETSGETKLDGRFVRQWETGIRTGGFFGAKFTDRPGPETALATGYLHGW